MPLDTSPADSAIDLAGPARARARGRRTRLFTILAGVVAGVAVLAIAYWLLVGQFHVTTDDAYVDADLAQITPLVSGPVTEVRAVDTQAVRAGDILVRIDDTDFKIALAQAQAQLGQAERRVRGYFANEAALTGQVAARDADIAKADAQIASARADLERAQIELGRRERLAASGAVSGDELTQAQNQFRTAQAALQSAKAGRVQAVASRGAAIGSKDVNTALISGAALEANPEVAAARANVEAAELNLKRTVLRAPFDGVVAKSQVALGERAQAGQTLMSVVPTTRVYVDANFKEVQLQKVRVGQPVILTADRYGDSVKFHGRVVGLAGGTGAAFSLIPAQNATGNWIKVVQRLPVRVELDSTELSEHPLRVGLSMKADIDVAAH